MEAMNKYLNNFTKASFRTLTALGITGAIRSTPLATLEMMVNLQPLVLFMKG